MKSFSTSSFGRFFVSTLLCLLVWPAISAPAAKGKSSLNAPPSATLHYDIKAQYNGMNINGSALMQWQQSGDDYTLKSETRASLLGKILSSSSAGKITPNGLKPSLFTEKRIRRSETSTRFNRQNKTISFSESGQSIPLKGNEQDRASVVWQLIAMARANPSRFKSGAEITIPVASRRGVDNWVFRVQSNKKVDTPAGRFDTVHLVRIKDQGKQRNEVWLAPALEWYPVKLVITEKENSRIEQSLQKILR